jgi:hypothetical protein
MWQLVDEAVNLFDATISDIGVTINYAIDGQDPIPSISNYIETMRISLWDSAFFLEFSLDKGIHKNKSSKDQVNFKLAMKRVLFKYFKFVSIIACSRKQFWRLGIWFIYLHVGGTWITFLRGPHLLKSLSVSHWSVLWKVRLLLPLKFKQRTLLRRVESGRNNSRGQEINPRGQEIYSSSHKFWCGYWSCIHPWGCGNLNCQPC